MFRLLEALWGTREGYGEIRAIKDGKVSQGFYKWRDVVDMADLRDSLATLRETHDVYFGVLLRKRPSGKAEDCEPMVHWLWADVDKKTGATFSSLLSAPVPPANIVVDSGHGWHLYWRLARPVSHTLAQQTMAAIASRIGGDAVGDPARILRLANTFNRKADPPMRVRILRMKLEDTWRLGDFPTAIVGEAERRKYAGAVGASGTRSEDLFRFAIEGVRKGLDDDEIYEQMLELPEGSKLREMKTEARRRRWFDLTVRKARRLTSLPPTT